MKKLIAVLLLILSTASMTSCGDMSFSLVKEVTDATVEKELLKAEKPAVLLIYGNPGSRSAWGWGEILEEFAEKYGDQLTFFHYNYKTNGKWFKKSKSNRLGQIRLYKSGKNIDSLKEMLMLGSHQEIGLRGQLFLFLKDHISKKAKDSNSAPIPLSKLLYEKRVASPGKGVSVIAFDRTADCGG